MKAQPNPTTIHTFKSLSSTTVWEAKNEFLAAGFIPAITGVNGSKRFQPRMADIEILSRRESPVCEVVN